MVIKKNSKSYVNSLARFALGVFRYVGGKKYLLAVISGLLGFAAFPPLDISFAAWIALVPLFYIVADTDQKSAFVYSYLAGLVFFGSVLYWLTVVSIPGYIILVAVLALFYGVFGLVARTAFKYSMDLFVVPFTWVVLEYIRANLFTGFPWALLGYSQYNNINLIQVADITGAYGISFIVVLFNAALFGWVSGAKRKVSHLMFALLFIVLATSYGMYRQDNIESDPAARISVVQGNISQDLKWDRRAAESITEKYVSLTRKAAKDVPDIIIWPETAYPYLLDEPEISAALMASLAEELEVSILAGVVYASQEDVYNSAALFSATGEFPAIYKKLHLVPFGEYIPFESYLGPLRNFIDKPIGSFSSGDKYKLFTLRAVRAYEQADGSLFRRTAFNKLGVLICFEDVFPYLARDFVNEGARILVNITNDAWFGDTAAAKQHMQSSVFRAVENRVPVVRAANTGISCFIDHTGRVFSKLRVNGRSTFVEGYDTAEVSTAQARSYYTLHGDMFVYLSAVILMLLFVIEKVLIEKKKTSL